MKTEIARTSQSPPPNTNAAYDGSVKYFGLSGKGAGMQFCLALRHMYSEEGVSSVAQKNLLHRARANTSRDDRVNSRISAMSSNGRRVMWHFVVSKAAAFSDASLAILCFLSTRGMTLVEINRSDARGTTVSILNSMMNE